MGAALVARVLLMSHYIKNCNLRFRVSCSLDFVSDTTRHFNFRVDVIRAKSICSIYIYYNVQMNYLVLCYLLIKIFLVVYH